MVEGSAVWDTTSAVFGSTRRALECAVAVQRGIKAHTSDDAVRARMGLTVGEVLEEGGHYFGATVDVASRIHAAAKPGVILVSEAVRAVVGSHPEMDFVDSGTAGVGDGGEELPVYEVPWTEEDSAAATERAWTHFVGRGEESATLTRLVDDARSGRGGWW